MKIKRIFRSNPDTDILHTQIALSCGQAREVPAELCNVNLNELLTGHRYGVLVAEAEGDSMEGKIETGDHVVIDQNIQAKTGDCIIAAVGEDYTIKVFTQKDDGLYLVANNGKYTPRKITSDDNFDIIGVVTHVVKKI